MKSSDDTSISIIPGTLVRSYSNSTDISNCIVGKSWLGTSFAVTTNDIDLSGNGILNSAISIDWLGTSTSIAKMIQFCGSITFNYIDK